MSGLIKKIIDKEKKIVSSVKTKIKSAYDKLHTFVKVGLRKFRLNVLKSKITPTDKRMKNNIYGSSVPRSLDLRSRMKPVRDQGSEGSCVAFSSCAMKEFQEAKEGTFVDYFSPWFIYLQREDITHPGMNLKNALDILKTNGVCSEVDFPYEKAASKNEISSAIYATAKKYAISDYALVETINELKSALTERGPCLIAFICYNSSPTFWKQANPSETSLGGHCVTVCGYDDLKGFLIRNSWGTDWGENGYTWFPYADFDLHAEIWSSLDVIIGNPAPSITNSTTTTSTALTTTTTPTTQPTQTTTVVDKKKSKKSWVWIIVLVVFLLIISSYLFLRYKYISYDMKMLYLNINIMIYNLRLKMLKLFRSK